MAVINVGTVLEHGATVAASVTLGMIINCGYVLDRGVGYDPVVSFTAASVQCSAVESTITTGVAAFSKWVSFPPITYPATIGTTDTLLASAVSTPESVSAATLNYKLHQISASAASASPSTGTANARSVFTINGVAASTPPLIDPNSSGVEIIMRTAVPAVVLPPTIYDATVYLGSAVLSTSVSTSPSTQTASVRSALGLVKTVELSPVVSAASVELTPTLALVSTKATAADFVDLYDTQRLKPLPVDVGGTTYQWSATAEGRIRLHDLSDNIPAWVVSKDSGDTPLVFDDGVLATFTDAQIAELRTQYDRQLRTRLDTLNSFLHGVLSGATVPLSDAQVDSFWPTLYHRVLGQGSSAPLSAYDAVAKLVYRIAGQAITTSVATQAATILYNCYVNVQTVTTAPTVSAATALLIYRIAGQTVTTAPTVSAASIT